MIRWCSDLAACLCFRSGSESTEKKNICADCFGFLEEPASTNLNWFRKLLELKVKRKTPTLIKFHSRCCFRVHHTSSAHPLRNCVKSSTNMRRRSSEASASCPARTSCADSLDCFPTRTSTRWVGSTSMPTTTYVEGVITAERDDVRRWRYHSTLISRWSASSTREYSFIFINKFTDLVLMRFLLSGIGVSAGRRRWHQQRRIDLILRVSGIWRSFMPTRCTLQDRISNLWQERQRERHVL